MCCNNVYNSKSCIFIRYIRAMNESVVFPSLDMYSLKKKKIANQCSDSVSQAGSYVDERALLMDYFSHQLKESYNTSAKVVGHLLVDLICVIGR